VLPWRYDAEMGTAYSLVVTRLFHKYTSMIKYLS